MSTVEIVSWVVLIWVVLMFGLLRLMRYAGDEPQDERIAEDFERAVRDKYRDVPLQHLLDSYEQTDKTSAYTDMERI